MAYAISPTLLCPGSPGDLVVFQRPVFKHYAVNVGNEEIVHVTSTEDGLNSMNVVDGITGHICSRNSEIAVVKKEKFSAFYKGEKVYVDEEHKKEPLPRREIVKRALSRVGEEGYNLFWKNCEHFARWCRYGEEESTQADTLKLVAGAVAVLGGAYMINKLLTDDSEEDKHKKKHKY